MLVQNMYHMVPTFFFFEIFSILIRMVNAFLRDFNVLFK